MGTVTVCSPGDSVVLEYVCLHHYSNDKMQTHNSDTHLSCNA